MQECPKGHLYPDTIKNCPVCEKHAAFQTILGKRDIVTKVTHEPLVTDVSPIVDKTHIPKNIIPVMPIQPLPDTANKPLPEIPDDDKTIFMGATDVLPVNFVVGWFIELDVNEMPTLSHPIENNKKIKIGRSNDNNIVLKNKTISRYHASIEYKDSKIFINDHNSANGIIINHKKVTSQIVEDNCVVEFGDLKCLIKYSV